MLDVDDPRKSVAPPSVQHMHLADVQDWILQTTQPMVRVTSDLNTYYLGHDNSVKAMKTPDSSSKDKKSLLEIVKGGKINHEQYFQDMLSPSVDKDDHDTNLHISVAKSF